jgi:hypothetical protein
MIRRSTNKVILTCLLLLGLWPSTADSGLPPQRERNVIWRDPGDVRRLDLALGPGGRAGAPAPPFNFVGESDSGTNPKIEVRDARGVIWGVKWGEEVNSEVFATRLVWAVGYYVEPSYFIRSGKILGVKKLDRAKKYVGSDGSFNDARFEKKEQGIQVLGDKDSWRYARNPFVGTKELNGLKIMIMLVSNWDSKDQEQAGKGSNTKILIVPTRAATEHRYVVSDWGGSMGKWGGVFKREKWDCDGYQGQSDDFVKGVKNGEVQWGYSGQHTSDIKDGIPVAHVQWLMGYLGKLTSSQIRAALRASGASPSEEVCFERAVRMRISALWNLR